MKTYLTPVNSEIFSPLSCAMDSIKDVYVLVPKTNHLQIQVTCEIAQKNQLVNKTFEILFHKYKVTYWKTWTVVRVLNVSHRQCGQKELGRKSPLNFWNRIGS